MRSLIQEVVNRNITIISQKEYDYVRIEYGDIVKGSVIKNCNYATLVDEEIYT